MDAAIEKNDKLNTTLLIKAAAALLVVIAAVVGVVMLFKHDFNPEKTELQGTYQCNRYYVVGNNGVYVSTFFRAFNDEGQILHISNTGKSAHSYDVDGECLIIYADGKVNSERLMKKTEDGLESWYQSEKTFTCEEIIELFGASVAGQMVKDHYDTALGKLISNSDWELLESADLGALEITLTVDVYEDCTFITSDVITDYSKAMARYEQMLAQQASPTDLSATDASTADISAKDE